MTITSSLRHAKVTEHWVVMSHSAQGRSASTRKADLSTGRVRYWSVRLLGLSLVLALAACGNSEEPSA
ncbi:MAG TPA: hypothetical protein ENI62_08245, partial [Gammaproteobacteria bacterium]|nr:hypothetical protein [Gammaproteobacteria bacterium]